MKNIKLLIGCLVFIVITFFIVLFCVFVTRDDVFYITTIPKGYSVVGKYDEESEFNVEVLVSDKKSYVVNGTMPVKSFISSSVSEEIITTKIKEVKDLKLDRKINGRKYFVYLFKIGIEMKTENDVSFQFENAVLNLEYTKNKDGLIKINIGNFYFYKVPYYGGENNYLNITRIKPIVNYVGSNKSLAGLMLEVDSNYEKEIIIKDVIILNNDLCISKNDIIKNNLEFDSGISIEEILGYDYNFFSKTENYDLDIIINRGESIQLILPFKYLNKKIVDTIGFIIKYEANNIEYNIYYDDFKYFEVNSLNLDISEIKITSYENS